MVNVALDLCKREEDRLNDSKFSGGRCLCRVLLCAELGHWRRSQEPDEDVVSKLRQMSPDMPKAELQRVAQGIDASGLQLDEHELEQLLKKVSKLLQVRRNIDAVTEMRLPYAAAVAAAESQRRDEESGPETPHDSNDV
jgi:hypothetical protein